MGPREKNGFWTAVVPEIEKLRFDDLLMVSFRQVVRQRRRSLGVFFAIALGTAALIVIITMGQDFKKTLNDDLELLGGATRIRVNFEANQDKYTIRRPQWFQEKTLQAIRRIPGVSAVTALAFIKGISLLGEDDTLFSLYTMAGVDEFFWKVNSFTPASGRFITKKDIEERKTVCVLGSVTAKKIFGKTDAVGKLVFIDNNYYQVVGLLDGLGLGSLDKWAFLPYTTAKDRVKGAWLQDTLYVRCSSWNEVKKVSSALPEVILANQDAKGIDVYVKEDHLDRVMRMAWWIEFFVYLAIAATLVLGGFGIWNIMMAGVQSRTREIGLKKAIGAKDRDILAQFLSEALCLSLTSAILGILLGRALMEILSFVLGCRPPEDLFILCVVLGILFAVLLGVGAGIAPSVRASRMEVVYAVRFE